MDARMFSLLEKALTTGEIGSVFVGHWSPESAGDYASGSNAGVSPTCVSDARIVPTGSSMTPTLPRPPNAMPVQGRTPRATRVTRRS